MSEELYKSSLEYHRYPTPGKIAIVATKPLSTQRDLALAYSPGVASACLAIAQDETQAAELTSRANLVAVISNGTAVLGLGNIGPLAAKPVMEGKAVLFKKFAGIDVFDLEIKENDPEKLIDIIASLEPTFGAINLEDIKAPECFAIEAKLKERMKIPVFHDDQHGTAIIVAAAFINGLKLVGKSIDQVKIVTSGAGAAALACLDMLVTIGVPIRNIFVTDQAGVVWEGRPEKMDSWKARYAQKTDHRTLSEVLEGADVFLGLSAAGVLKSEMLSKLATQPLIFALANPQPEIAPEIVKELRPDAIMATGRSDYPNQVNNVLCYPYIFRGALDVGATTINEEMKKACVYALAHLAMAEPSDVVSAAYGGADYTFGAEYLIPKPFDPRLVVELSLAVAVAAMETGVATRPLENINAYRQKLTEFVFRSGLVMRSVFNRAKSDPKRIVYTEGEDPKILRAAQMVIEEGIAQVILIGRRDVVERRIKTLGLRIRPDTDFSLTDPQLDSRFQEYWQAYHQRMERRGVTPDSAKVAVRTDTSVIGTLMVELGQADAVICGPIGRYGHHLKIIEDIIGHENHIESIAALNALILDKGVFFFCDAYVNENPSAEQLAHMTVIAATEVQRFGVTPKVALLSHSSFGTSSRHSATKMQQVLSLVRAQMPELEIEGEMHGDAALDPAIRQAIFPNSKLTGIANLLIMPDIDAANIAFNLCKSFGEGQSIGPILLGAKKPAHILTPSATVRGIINMTAFAVVEAQE